MTLIALHMATGEQQILGLRGHFCNTRQNASFLHLLILHNIHISYDWHSVHIAVAKIKTKDYPYAAEEHHYSFHVGFAVFVE